MCITHNAAKPLSDITGSQPSDHVQTLHYVKFLIIIQMNLNEFRSFWCNYCFTMSLTEECCSPCWDPLMVEFDWVLLSFFKSVLQLYGSAILTDDLSIPLNDIYPVCIYTSNCLYFYKWCHVHVGMMVMNLFLGHWRKSWWTLEFLDPPGHIHTDIRWVQWYHPTTQWCYIVM